MGWFEDLFIKEAKPALDRHSGSGGGSSSDSETQTYILVDENGNEIPAVLVGEETVFDATANDIREGKVAATDSGVTVGTKEIPAYYVSEGVTIVPAGSSISIMSLKRYDYTKLQAIVCAFNSDMNNSVSAEKVVINEKVYAVNSTESISNVTVDNEKQSIVFGIMNEGATPLILRYFTYKEEA